MKINVVRKEPSQSASEYAYNTIRENIIEINLKPGEIITENEIASVLEVSRTPVREAFGKLVGEDLLEIYPQKGTLVSLINIKHIEEAEFLRINLEIPVMKRACENFSDETLFEIETNINQQQFCLDKEKYANNIDLDITMHHLIFKGCGMERIWGAIHSMSGDLDRVRTLNLISVHDWDKVIKQHKAILNAIKTKNPVLGEKVMYEHIIKVPSDWYLLKEKYEAYFK